MSPPSWEKAAQRQREGPACKRPGDRAALTQVPEDTGDAISFLPSWKACDLAVSKSPWRRMKLTNWLWGKSCDFYPVQNYLSFVI